MPDLSQIEGFEWDEGNSRKSIDKHAVSQAEAEQVFFNEPLLIVEDVRHSSYEIRLHALGFTTAELARCFLRLATLSDYALDRLSRYEAILCARSVKPALFPY